METKPVDLYEFLVESELQQYYNSIKNELKISMVTHLKYASDEDLKQVGLSKPEIRRLRKFYEKYYPHGYLSKIKRLLQNPTKREDGTTLNLATANEAVKVTNSPNKMPNNKHIIPADSICVNKQLGVGEFGIVQQGVWTNGSERIQVAIKCLCRERMQSNPMEFLKEAAIMHSIEHENIVRLYGVVLDTDSLMLVTELAHLRSLLECLKDPGLRVSFLTVPTLCEFAMQICNGMMYLENKRLIHRDLAARNILVFSKTKVKISDFGLSRALGVGKDYYQTNFNVNLKLPIAWCAPECINFLRFTNASDVWAYGVCLWEMFSYGFQPWAALTGHQILEAIDEPHYQRLEQPECCPREYYTLMLKCWQHDPSKRPKFTDIYGTLPDMKPEQLKTIAASNESKKDHLVYRQSEIITVLDKSTTLPYWKGVLNSGKTGLFNPSNTVAYLGNSLPSSTNRDRDSFPRGSERTSSKRKLCPEMISGPQNDLKHTGHVGLDGAYFGNIPYLSPSTQNYNHVPRQIVTPYKPSEDIEQTPLLLPPTPTSPDSLQTASGYFSENGPAATNHSFINANMNTSTRSNDAFGSTYDFANQNVPTTSTSNFVSSNPFLCINSNHHKMSEDGAFVNANMQDDSYTKDNRHKNHKWPENSSEPSHEYHEISDDEMPGEKFDLGPSLLDEMDLMFRSMNAAVEHEAQSPDFDTTNKKNEISEFASKFHRKNSGGLLAGSLTNKSRKKTAASVKPISFKDEKILNHAIDNTIDVANEVSAKSMTDLANDANSTHSPKRKFSFRFPHLVHQGSYDRADSPTGNSKYVNSKRNFCDEIKNVPDLQSSLTEESSVAYNILVEKPDHALRHFGHDNLDEVHNLKDHLHLSASTSALQSPRKCTPDLTIEIPSDEKLKSKEADLFVPSPSAMRPTTLPCRASASKASRMMVTDVDSNPLRVLRDKNYPIVRPRVRVNMGTDAPSEFHGHGDSDKDSACESPSYLSTTEYTFSERDVNIHRGDTQKFCGSKEIENLNPIPPLPPRDRTKVLLTNVKRHVRKHPLIIPASGLQRTLNKVKTPVEEKALPVFPNVDEIDCGIKSPSYENNYNKPRTSTKPAEVTKLQPIDDHSYINQEDVHITESSEGPVFRRHTDSGSSDDCRTYENLNTLRGHLDNTDSASLHFESILEGDINQLDDRTSSDETNGFMFENYDVPRASGNRHSTPVMDSKRPTSFQCRMSEFEKRRLEFAQKYPNYVQPRNETITNAFAKYRDSRDRNQNSVASFSKSPIDSLNNNAIQSVDADSLDDLNDEDDKALERKLKDSNSVSCEDLLELSQKKPKGKERGAESDEVRIMTKVLGTTTTPEQCIVALDFIEWNVHKAIKLIRLQNALALTSCINLEECMEALQKYDWDVQTASIQLASATNFRSINPL